MRFRLSAFACVIAFIIAVALICFYMYSPHHRINEDSYDRIRIGMTEDQVVNIIGVAYGQYYSGTADVIAPIGAFNSTGSIVTNHLDGKILSESVFSNGELAFRRKGWVGADMSIWVCFDKNGLVFNKISYPVTPIYRGVCGWVEKWLPW